MLKITLFVLYSSLFGTTQPMEGDASIYERNFEVVGPSKMDDSACMAYVNDKKYVKALRCYEDIIEKELETRKGKEFSHLDELAALGEAYLMVGSTSYTEGYREKARVSWTKTLEIFKATLGEDHSKTQEVVDELAFFSTRYYMPTFITRHSTKIMVALSSFTILFAMYAFYFCSLIRRRQKIHPI